MRILFVGWTRIGDAVISTTLLRHLVDTHPDARITLVCGPLAALVLRHLPGLETLHILRKKTWNRHWLDLLPKVVGRRWDLIVDLRDSVVSWLVPARRVLTFRKSAPGARQVDDLARLMGLPVAPFPKIWLSEGEVAQAADLLPGTVPTLGFALSAGRPEKVWPADRFLDLAERLLSRGPLAGGRLVRFGGPGEEDLAAPVRSRMAALGVVDLTDRPPDLLVQAACLGRCSLYVGADSGLSHVAAAMDIPTLAVFGPTDPRRYTPYGRRSLAVGGTTADTPRRMETVTVEEVEGAAWHLLQTRAV